MLKRVCCCRFSGRLQYAISTFFFMSSFPLIEKDYYAEAGLDVLCGVVESLTIKTAGE